jgi:hypothetical protein
MSTGQIIDVKLIELENFPLYPHFIWFCLEKGWGFGGGVGSYHPMRGMGATNPRRNTRKWNIISMLLSAWFFSNKLFFEREVDISLPDILLQAVFNEFFICQWM